MSRPNPFRLAATITPLLSPQDQQALGDAFEVIEQ